MDLKQGAQGAAGLIVAGVVLLGLSVFVADRQLDSPFDEAELAPIAIPAGSTLDPDFLLYSSDRTGNFEIYASEPNGRGQALTNDASFDSWRPRLSPDRRTILFYRTPVGRVDNDLAEAALWMVGAEGGVAVEVLPVRAHGWTRHGGAEWSPLGNELVMMGERPPGMQIWVTSADGRDVRNLINDPGDNTDPSWSPDARSILFVACEAAPCDDDQREVFAISSGGRDRVQITDDDVRDELPRFSPDGTQIVMRSRFGIPDEEGQGAVWTIRVGPGNGSRPPRRIVNDDTMSDSPVWLNDENVLFDRIPTDSTDAGIFSVRVSDATITAVLNTTANERFPHAG